MRANYWIKHDLIHTLPIVYQFNQSRDSTLETQLLEYQCRGKAAYSKTVAHELIMIHAGITFLFFTDWGQASILVLTLNRSRSDSIEL